MSVLFAEFLERIPRPVPDADALPEYHYMTVKNTPLTDNNGKDRLPDDWQPRSNIRTLFEQKKLSIEDTDADSSADSENETDSDDDLIFYESDSEIDSSGTDKLPIQQQTSRSGRKTGHWSARYADFVTN